MGVWSWLYRWRDKGSGRVGGCEMVDDSKKGSDCSMFIFVWIVLLSDDTKHDSFFRLLWLIWLWD